MSIVFYINFIMVIPECTVSEQTNIKTTFIGKRYESMFCGMYVVTSVTTSRLTETIPIAKFFSFCCQASAICMNLCFPIIAKFKEL